VREAKEKRDLGHMQWLWDIADHSEVCLHGDGPTAASEALATKLNEQKFGYLSEKDRILLREAVILRCEAFLTVERRLPRNAAHIQSKLGIRVMTPITHWEMMRPWAALWR
jgi:hypothetical protein